MGFTHHHHHRHHSTTPSALQATLGALIRTIPFVVTLALTVGIGLGATGTSAEATAAEIAIQLSPGAGNDPFAGRQGRVKAMGAYVTVIYNRGATAEVITAVRAREGQQVGEFRSADRRVIVKPDVMEGRKADFTFENVDASTLHIVVVDFPRLEADAVMAREFPTMQATVTIRDGGRVSSHLIKPAADARGNRFIIGQFEGTRMIAAGHVMETPRRSSLTVRVRDRNGQPVAGVSVALMGAADQTLVTSTDGSAQFDGLISGIFHLDVRSEGWIGERRWFATNFHPAMPMVITVYLQRGNPPRYYGQEIVSRRVVFVVDLSGSMQGRRWTAARAELKQCIDALPADAEFTVIAFNDQSWPWSRELKPATDANKTAIKQWLDGCNPTGMTNILAAMQDGLKILSAARSSQSVAAAGEELFLLSDGAPTIGETNSERIVAGIANANPGNRVRIHAFEIGNEATALLQRIAQQNQSGRYVAVPAD